MLKKIIIGTILSSIAFAGINSTYKESGIYETLDKLDNNKLIEKLVLHDQKKLPINVDSYTNIISIEDSNNSITYNIKISQTDLETAMGQKVEFNQAFGQKLGTFSFKQIRSQLCTTNSSIYVIERGISYNYIYTYDNGDQIIDFSIAIEDCKDLNKIKE